MNISYKFFFRLLVILPPSIDHMNSQCTENLVTGSMALHSLLWIPRAANTKAFSRWMTDSLVKQVLLYIFILNILSFYENIKESSCA